MTSFKIYWTCNVICCEPLLNTAVNYVTLLLLIWMIPGLKACTEIVRCASISSPVSPSNIQYSTEFDLRLSPSAQFSFRYSIITLPWDTIRTEILIVSLNKSPSIFSTCSYQHLPPHCRVRLLQCILLYEVHCLAQNDTLFSLVVNDFFLSSCSRVAAFERRKFEISWKTNLKQFVWITRVIYIQKF
jgi:hypothetical protein